MIEPTKKLGSWLLIGVYALVCGEVIMRVIAAFVVIPDIELMIYARDLTRPSAVAALATEHVPGASDTLMGHRIALNDRGHRSPPLRTPRPSAEKRVYFMGTSITLGWGVGQDETFAAVVGKMLTANAAPGSGQTYAVINAGVASYNTENELALFKRDLESVQPDAVILQYYLRDAEPAPEARDSRLLKTSYLAAFFYRYIRGLLAAEGGAPGGHFQALYRDGNPDWERTKKAIAELAALCRQRGVALAAVLIPDLRDPSPKFPYAALYVGIKAYFSQTGIDVIDPHEAVRRQVKDDPGRGWVHPADPHPNAAVHRIIGREIYEYLARRWGAA